MRGRLDWRLTDGLTMPIPNNIILTLITRWMGLTNWIYRLFTGSWPGEALRWPVKSMQSRVRSRWFGKLYARVAAATHHDQSAAEGFCAARRDRGWRRGTGFLCNFKIRLLLSESTAVKWRKSWTRGDNKLYWHGVSTLVTGWARRGPECIYSSASLIRGIETGGGWSGVTDTAITGTHASPSSSFLFFCWRFLLGISFACLLINV